MSEKTYYVLEVGGTDWDDACEVTAKSAEEAARLSDVMESLEESASDVPSTAAVWVSEHADGHHAIKFGMSVQVTWTYEVKRIKDGKP